MCQVLGNHSRYLGFTTRIWGTDLVYEPTAF